MLYNYNFLLTIFIIVYYYLYKFKLLIQIPNYQSLYQLFSNRFSLSPQMSNNKNEYIDQFQQTQQNKYQVDQQTVQTQINYSHIGNTLGKHQQSSDQSINPIQIQYNSKSNKSKQICKIIAICILSVFILYFISISLNCLLSKQIQNKNQRLIQNKQQTLNEKEYIDNQTKDINRNSVTKTEQQKTQGIQDVQQLKSTILNLQIQIYKLKQQIKSLTNQSNQINQHKFRLRSKQRNNIPPIQTKNHYQFNLSIDTIVDKSNFKNNPNDQALKSGIKQQFYQRAIRLMEVVHNINFKGQYVFDHYNFYSSPQQKFNHLSKLLKDQKQYYQHKYQINKYIHDQIGICVIVTSFNNAKSRIYLRNLDSIFQQEYHSYHVVYVNDASTDDTGKYVQWYMEENQIPQSKYLLINNQKNKGSSANHYMAVHNYCQQGEIMISVDGDDALIGRQVFALLNAVYQRDKVALTYGQFLMVKQNKITGGFVRVIPNENLQNGTFRKLKRFYSTHLKTMYVDVMRQINITDFQYSNGTFINYASDVTFMTPSIQLVGTRLQLVRQLIYEYRFDTGLNEAYSGQKGVSNEVYAKKPYNKMQNMSFADNPKTIHYD